MLRLVILEVGGRCSLPIFGIWVEVFEPSLFILTPSAVWFCSLFIFYIQKFPSLMYYPNLLFKWMFLPWNKFVKIFREMMMMGNKHNYGEFWSSQYRPSQDRYFCMLISEDIAWKIKMKTSWRHLETPRRRCIYMGNNDELLLGPWSHSVIATIDFNGSKVWLWILA